MPSREDAKKLSDLVVLKKAGADERRARATLNQPAVIKVGRRPVDLARRRPSALLDYRRAVELVRKHRVMLKHHSGAGELITFSPRRNYIEGHGHLNFINVSHVFGENDQAWFIQNDAVPDDYRKVELWLTGLTVGASYMVQLRVTGSADGTWEIRGSDTAGVQTVTGGYELTIPVLIYEVDYNMSLVTLQAAKMWQWGFYDATVTEL